MKKEKIKKTDAEILEKNLAKISEKYYWNYSGDVKYEYDSYQACQHGSNCCDNDYCRCGVIKDIKITHVDVIGITNSLSQNLESEVLSYCIDRIVSSSGLASIDSWEVNVRGGYYGEEIDSVTLDTLIEFKLKEELSKLIEAKTDFEKVKVALEAEYGYLLPALLFEAHDVVIEEVPMKLIKMGNDDYMKKVDKKILAFYENYKLPRAVCIVNKNHSYLRVIDGYHRTTAALQNKLETIKVLILRQL